MPTPGSDSDQEDDDRIRRVGEKAGGCLSVFVLSVITLLFILCSCGPYDPYTANRDIEKKVKTVADSTNSTKN